MLRMAYKTVRQVGGDNFCRKRKFAQDLKSAEQQLKSDLKEKFMIGMR